MKTVQDRNLSGSNIRNHLRDEERIELGTVFFMEGIVTCFFFKCTDSTNTGTKDDADFVQILIFDIKTGIFYRLLGYTDGILSVQVHLASLFAVDILIGIKVLHFACELGLEKRCVEMSNRPRSTNPIHEIFPKFGYCVANGSNGAKTCYYNSF